MAPIITVSAVHKQSYLVPPSSTAADVAALKRRNEELERELKKSHEREEKMKAELTKMWNKIQVAEEAVEMLCSQIGELEAEVASQERAYGDHVSALMEQLASSQKLLESASISFPAQQ